MNYVIIGNSAAGIGAVEGIRKYDQQGKITIISDEPYHTYSRPLISYYLAGKVNQEQMKFRPYDFYEKNRVETILGKRAVKIDQSSKTVSLEDGQQIGFDKLLLATGGKPFIPPIKGSEMENILTFIKMDDVRAIAERLETAGVRDCQGREDYPEKERIVVTGHDQLRPVKAVILGAGLIGLKAAEALVKLGVKVTVVELADRVLSTILDHEAAALVQSHLEDKGISFELEDTIEEFIGEKAVRKVRLKSGFVINCDLAIVAVGVRPKVNLVEGTGIEINRGILVNKKMETNIEDIYAAGDVAEGYDMLKGTAGVIPIWPNAYNQGLTAGENMTGADKTYEEGFARNSIGFFGLPMITAGIINPEGDEYEILVDKAVEDNTYRKVVLRDDKIVGFIYLNKVDRAGILTGLIKEQQDIGDIKEKILADDFGYLTFSEEWRRAKLWK